MRSFARIVLAFATALLTIGQVWGQELTLVTTTSIKDSGLLSDLLPRYRAATGVTIKAIAVGTGQAIDMARRGDADLLIAHDEEQERIFVEEGFAKVRRSIMHNDFVLVGPSRDPARIKAVSSAEGLQRIKAAKATFVSRGDRSGTHTAELRIWARAGVSKSELAGDWYRSIGAGMGAALNMASATDAYTLSDRGTWLSFKNKSDLIILIEGGKELRNQYSVLTVSKVKHPHVREAEAERFALWLVGAQGQSAIANFQVDGKQLFHPNSSAD